MTTVRAHKRAAHTQKVSHRERAIKLGKQSGIIMYLGTFVKLSNGLTGFFLELGLGFSVRVRVRI